MYKDTNTIRHGCKQRVTNRKGNAEKIIQFNMTALEKKKP